MKKTTLKNINISGNTFENLTVFFDKEGSIVLLPLLYTIFLENTGEVIKYREYEKNGEIYKELYEDPIADSSIDGYIGNVYKFFEYIEAESDEKLPPSVHHTYLLKPSFIRDYLNKHLVKTLTDTSLGVHQASIKSYFNFVAKLGLVNPLNIKVTRKAKKEAFDNNRSQNKINYISTEERISLLNKCTNKRDRLILRNGFEVGMRTKENTGLLLKYKNKEKGYLLDLFKQLDDPEKSHINTFKYWLHGRYTKGQRSRWIFFDRQLLEAMKDYYYTERAAVLSKIIDKGDPDALLLNDDRRYFGEPISRRLGTDVFAKYRAMVDWMDQSLSYHDLRHTFATELYHSEIINEAGKETRSQSAALIKVAQRLGHKLGKNGKPAEVTTRYIRLRETMLDVEGGE
ncbi:MAG: site-specific integrase [Colwellia sp.]|nr:site-specific integrase [Colwellia sp.]